MTWRTPQGDDRHDQQDRNVTLIEIGGHGIVAVRRSKVQGVVIPFDLQSCVSYDANLVSGWTRDQPDWLTTSRLVIDDAKRVFDELSRWLRDRTLVKVNVVAR